MYKTCLQELFHYLCRQDEEICSEIDKPQKTQIP